MKLRTIIDQQKLNNSYRLSNTTSARTMVVCPRNGGQYNGTQFQPRLKTYVGTLFIIINVSLKLVESTIINNNKMKKVEETYGFYDRCQC